MWKVVLDDGSAFCLKTAPPAALARERVALETLRERGFQYAPHPIGRVPGPPPGWLSTWIDGTPGDPEDPIQLEALGRTLRALHDIPFDDPDPVPLRDALGLRLRGWLKRALEHLEPPVCRAVEQQLDADAFQNARRVLCHRDVTGSNWVFGHDGKTSLIDFGQARPDIALADLAKLAARWRDAPEAETALLRGYGELSRDQRRQLDNLVLLHGLQTAVWGREHRDTGFAALGDRILKRALV